MKVKFSIIIPVYNKISYILQSVQSILDQNYDNYEIIIIDDCSTDGSYEILNDIKECTNKIVVLKNDKNRGVSYTRNRGIEIATGKYLLFLDADDRISKNNFFECMNLVINKYDSKYILLTRNYHDSLLKPDYNKIKKRLKTIEDDYYIIEDKMNVIIDGQFPFGGSASALISKELVQDTLFNINEKRFEDWLFFLDIYMKSQPYYYRVESIYINLDLNSLSRNYSKYEIEKIPQLYYYLDADRKNRVIRKAFFWNWFDYAFSRSLTLKDNIILLNKFKYLIIKNSICYFNSLKSVIRIIYRLLKKY